MPRHIRVEAIRAPLQFVPKKNPLQKKERKTGNQALLEHLTGIGSKMLS